MKNIFKLVGTVLGCLMLIHCTRNSPQHNVVYLTAAETSATTSLTADTTGSEMAVTAKTAEVVSAPVTVTMEIDTALIQEYNISTGKKYSPLPDGSYELTGKSVVINAGASMSDAIKLRILTTKGFKDGVSYLVPVTIKTASSLPILEASKTLYVVVNRIVFSTVASLAGSNSFKVDFSTNNSALKSMSNISYEVRVMVNQFQSSSPFISSLMGIEENFLLRFGDVTITPSQLQMAGGLTATNVAQPFLTGTWYHIAAVYDGSMLKIYVNGNPVAATTAARTVDLTSGGGFYFGYSAGGRYLNGVISEGRVWSRALTQPEILNGMCGIDPASPGLVGYWKFNEGTGNTAHDISGNGHDAVAAKTVTWIPNVKCN